MDKSYLPVAWAYKESIQKAIKEKKEGRIFYFCEEGEICSSDGLITKVENIKSKGTFIFMDSGEKIRIDRIITLFGRPGAAYDEYDAYSNECMSCFGDHGANDQ